MSCNKRCKVIVMRNLLLFLTLIGVLLGLAIGFALRPTEPSDDALMWLGLPGKIYLRLLKMMIVPLIVASVITGTANLEPKANGKISVVAITYIFVTNMIGAILGVVMFIIFKPGVRDPTYADDNGVSTDILETQDVFADLIRNIFPDNLIESTFSQSQTAYTRVNVTKRSSSYATEIASNATEFGTNATDSASNATETVEKVIKSVVTTGGTNFLGLVFACTVIGMATAKAGKKGRVLVDLCESINNTTVIIIQWFMWTTPIGVLSLIMVAVAAISDVGGVMTQLGIFIIAVTIGLTIQQLVVLSGIYFAVTMKNPFRFLLDVSKPWLIAFASSATVVAMPEMLTICEGKMKSDRRVARFVVPLSVTLSANGSAVYISCACLFISNLAGKTPTAAVYLTVGILVAVSAMAIPSVPSASIVTIVIILTSLNLPIEAIALLLAVEFFLDRIRTTSSVLSDMICVIVTEKICSNELQSKAPADYEDSLDVVFEAKCMANGKEEMFPLNDEAV